MWLRKHVFVFLFRDIKMALVITSSCMYSDTINIIAVEDLVTYVDQVPRSNSVSAPEGLNIQSLLRNVLYLSMEILM